MLVISILGIDVIPLPASPASTLLVQRDTCRVTLCASPDQMHKSGASGLEVYKCHHGASPGPKSAHTYRDHHRLTTSFKHDPTGLCVFGRTWRKPLVRTKDRMTAGRFVEICPGFVPVPGLGIRKHGNPQRRHIAKRGHCIRQTIFKETPSVREVWPWTLLVIQTSRKWKYPIPTLTLHICPFSYP